MGRKTLYLLRHAKSSWAEVGMNDFDRPLKTSGVYDARGLAKIYKEELSQLDIIVSSPANRAMHTAILFCDTVGLPMDTIRLNESIYEAHESVIHRIINQLPNEHSCAMIVGHNPTFTYIANEFLPSPIDNLPTCGIVKIVFDIKSWDQVSRSTVVSAVFDYPKNHQF
jgi:phosphohistidine phosphatase